MYKKIIDNGLETNYSVSEQGEIRNDRTQRIMTINKGRVQLYINGKNARRSVGKIVADAFIPKVSNDQELIIHLDGDENNNNINNLKWITQKENSQNTWNKRRENGTTGVGIKRNTYKRENIVDLESVDYELKDNEKIVILDNIKYPYAISTEGKLRNIITNKYLKGTILNTYLVFNLRLNGNQKNIAAHKLVAIMFIPNPENKEYVDHINGIRTDNRIENLRWATVKGNNLNHHKDIQYSIKGLKNYSLSLKNLEDEEWKQVENSEFYVSNLGRVKNIKTNKILKGSIRTDGYHQTKTKLNNGKAILTHRLVWTAFNGEIDENQVINHINGIKNDNRLSNLELVTHQENMQKASEETNAWNFSKVGEFDENGKLLREFANASVAARAIGILPSSIRNTIKRNGKCYNGLSYKYLDK